MNFDDLKNIISKSDAYTNLLDYGIINIPNKSFLNISDSKKSILIKLENILHIESVNLIEFIVNRYQSMFITAEKLDNVNENIYVIYNIDNEDLLILNNDFLKDISPFNILSLLKDFLILLLKLLLLKEDFSLFDARLFYFHKDTKGKINIKYLFTCKFN